VTGLLSLPVNPALSEDKWIKTELRKEYQLPQVEEINLGGHPPEPYLMERILVTLNLFDFFGPETPPEGICELEFSSLPRGLLRGCFF